MDPAFSLADELAGHTLDHYDAHAYGGSLGDEFDALHAQASSSLGDELLEPRAGSLADELAPVNGYGSLADELAPPHEVGGEGLEDGDEEEEEVGGMGGMGGGRLRTVAEETGMIQASISATHAFLERLSSLSKQSRQGEETEQLEVAAAGYLKCVSQCSAEREAQLRELRELDRKLSRSFHHPLEPVETEADSSLAHASESMGSIVTIREEVDEAGMVDLSMFTPVYASTSALVGSLTQLHEHTQVTKSSTADAQRRLKSLRTLLAQWHADHDSAQQSHSWIASHPPLPLTASSLAESSLDYCRQRLDDAHASATALLTPTRIPA